MSEPPQSAAEWPGRTAAAAAARHTGADALPDYAPMSAATRTDAQRWPLLSAPGLQRVHQWRGHPRAPLWRHACGDLLTEPDLTELSSYAAHLAGYAAKPTAGQGPPRWVADLVAHCQAVVPRYRGDTRTFEDLVPVCRDDLAASVASFVPDDLPLERLVQTSSSGTTGAALVLPQHPVTVAAELVLLERLVADTGAAWPHDHQRMALLNVTDQRQAFTYVSALTWRREQVMARVNLADAEWAAPGDREAFLAATDAQVVSGTALSLVALARLDVPELRPVALISGAVALTPAAREELLQRFGVPVLDLYGTKETGPFAVAAGPVSAGGHVVVTPDVWVEVLDTTGQPVPNGQRGEITVTSRANPYLPLLRYRTGDYGALAARDGRQVIEGLVGRAPVVFRRPDGTGVPSVDLHQQLQHHGAIAWSVVQDEAGQVHARVFGGDADRLREALSAALDRLVSVELVDELAELGPGKPRSFSRRSH